MVKTAQLNVTLKLMRIKIISDTATSISIVSKELKSPENGNRHLITFDANDCESINNLGIKKWLLRDDWDANDDGDDENLVDDVISSSSDSTTSLLSNYLHVIDDLNESCKKEFFSDLYRQYLRDILPVNEVRAVRHYVNSNVDVKDNVSVYQNNNRDSTILKKSNKLNISNDHDIERGKIPWPEGTCLIAGDYTILGLQERRMSKNFKYVVSMVLL